MPYALSQWRVLASNALVTLLRKSPLSHYVAHTTRLYAKVWPHMQILTHSHLCISHTDAHTPTHTFPLSCISETTGRIEAKFFMHMQCDQPIILHNNNKLTWGHLGYANEGQRSNLMNFVLKISQKRNEQSSSNFYSILALMRNG